MHAYTLYSYYRSSASFRVRAALHLKRIAYAYRPVHLLDGGGRQYAPEYLALNPMGEVPALAIHDATGQLVAVLAQSVAILEYLEETHPEPPLLPRAPLDRARVRQLVECVNSGIQPLQNLKVGRRLTEEFGLDDAAVARWCAGWIARGFGGIEAILQTTAGRFACGDAPTWADCALVPQLPNARRYGVDLGAYPTLVRVTDAALALPAFQAAAPDAQPDAPTAVPEGVR